MRLQLLHYIAKPLRIQFKVDGTAASIFKMIYKDSPKGTEGLPPPPQDYTK
ncbi:hypothetical protein V1279_004336 [Bradyrhizobium sp. AZCC 1610]|uniref:hypothetical protein n=1 Tax=Bradyrhizobium sp. AZCC 1610 TaxID=3117020 RepID=UPI002FF16239